MLSNIAHAFGGFNNLLHKFAASKGKKMQKRLFAAAAAANLHNQNHQLSWWYALCLEGIFAGSPIRALNEIFIRIKFTGYC